MKRLFFAAIVAVAAGCAAPTDDPSDFTGGERNVAAEPSGAAIVLRTEGPAVVRGSNAFVLGPFGGKVVKASGFMPAHGHGTKGATIEALEDGSQKVGLVLYMSGRWEVSFEIDRGGISETVRVDVQVP